MGEGPLDDPALAAEAGAGGDAPAGDDRRDAALAHQAAVLVMGHSRGRRGRPQGVFADRPLRPPIGRTASISGISWVTSLRWPPVSVTASGMPEASTSRWCFELKAGAIDRAQGRSGAPKNRPYVAGVCGRPRPVDLPGRVQTDQKAMVQLLPDPGRLPVAQAPPAGHPRAVAELLRAGRARRSRCLRT